MRKSLSLNGKPRSTNKAKGARHHAPGYVPSFSNVLAQVSQSIHKTKGDYRTSEDGGTSPIYGLIRSIQRLSKRIKKAKLFLNGPISEETEEKKEARRKILRWEALQTQMIIKLQSINDNQLKIWEREKKKFKGSSRDPNFLTSKQKEPGNMEPIGSDKIIMESITSRDTGYHPLVKDHKRSTSKREVFKEYNPLEVTDEKRSTEKWKSIVQKRNREYAKELGTNPRKPENS